MDTPGVLWPKFESEEVAFNLAITGAIKDAVMNTEEIAGKLLIWLSENYPEYLKNRYGISVNDHNNNNMLLDFVAKKRGFLLPGGGIDTNRAASIVLDEFRAAKIGRISLEKPFKPH